jgi:hypothetical protein
MVPVLAFFFLDLLRFFFFSVNSQTISGKSNVMSLGVGRMSEDKTGTYRH